MTANIDAMIRAAQQAYGRGEKAEARALLERAIDLDEYNESAWLWLSAVVETAEDQRICLENVLSINPNNERAKMGLKSMGIDPSTLIGDKAGAAGGGNASVFTDTSFIDASEDPFGDVDFGATAGNWDASSGIATSSASANYQGPQMTRDDLDNWVDNLNIGSNPQQADAGVDFTSGPFGQPQAPAVPEIPDTGLFGQDDLFAEEDDPVAYAQASPYTPLDLTAPLEDEEDYDALISEDEADENDGIYDEDLLGGGAFGNFGGDDAEDMDEDEGEETDLQTMFEIIPAEIPVGRLPGTDEKAGAGGGGIFVGLLLLLNVGAGVFVALRMTGVL